MERKHDTEQSKERRAYRRKRRIRNQIISYIVLVVLIIGCVAGGYYVANNVLHKSDKDNTVVNGETPTPPNDSDGDDPTLVPEEPVEPDEPTEPDEPADVPVVEEPDPQEVLLNEMIDSYISQMSLQDKVAALFIVTPEQLTGVNKVTVAGKTTQSKLNEYPVGGLIYFSKNIVSYTDFKTMLEKTQEMSKYPMFLCIDEEGGSVARVASTVSTVNETDHMSIIGATGEPANAAAAYTYIGSYLSDLGINVNFAPVSDVQTSINTLFDKRAFGSDPSLVSNFVSMSVIALQEQKISACVKHFPGHGATDGDSETGMATTQRTLEEMRTAEFLPFISGMDAGSDFVMVGHISTPAVTGDQVPASLSKTWITDVLRNELGYEEIIITDALNMPAITEYYLPGDAAILALQAGADMLLMPENFVDAYNAVLNAVAQGTVTEQRIDESLRRIYRVKCRQKMITELGDIAE